MTKTTDNLSLLLLLAVSISLPAYAGAPDAKKGQQVFENNTCIDCHVGGGNSVKPSKPIKGEAFAKKYKDDAKIEKVIREGIAGTTMLPTRKEQINDSDLKDLVAYIRSLTPASGGKADKKSAKKVSNSSR
jgi:mono/diheme cytochrome c family protein